MESIRQLVTRRRRIDIPQLEYPDCYDEYIGREPTGRILTSDGKEIHLTKNIPTENISNDNEVETVVSTVYQITVTHHYGQTTFEPYEKDEFEKLDLEEYIIMLNNKYWKNFVSSIDVREITLS